MANGMAILKNNPIRPEIRGPTILKIKLATKKKPTTAKIRTTIG
jgi:hypothetical protein